MLYSTNPLIFVMTRKANIEKKIIFIQRNSFIILTENSLLVPGFGQVGKRDDRNELDR